MSTQDPYGTSDQPPRTGSSASGSSSGSQPSWQQSAPSGPSGQGYPAGPQQGGGYQQGGGQPAPYQDDRAGQGGYPAYAGQGGYDRPAPKNGLGLAALVLGIIGLLTSWLVFGGLLGLVAVVLGVLGLGRVRKGLATNRGMAITGVVLGVLSILAAIAVSVGLFALGSQVADCNQYIENNDQAGYQQCLEDQLGVQGS